MSEARACTVEGCTKRLLARGMCPMHLRRWNVHGDVNKVLSPVPPRIVDNRTPIERVLAKVEIDLSSGCWRFIGARTRGGYGLIGNVGGSRLVHRISYEFYVAPIPAGYEVDHVRERGCKHSDCCNPDHLEAVTGDENRRRQHAWLSAKQ